MITVMQLCPLLSAILYIFQLKLINTQKSDELKAQDTIKTIYYLVSRSAIQEILMTEYSVDIVWSANIYFGTYFC